VHIQLQLRPAVCADLRSCCAEASCTWHVSCTPYMHVGGTGLSSSALGSPWHHVLHGASSQKHSCRCGRSGGGEIWPSVLLHVHSSMHLTSSTCVRLDGRAPTVLLHAWQPVHTSSERACSTNAAPTACVHKQLNATRVHAHISSSCCGSMRHPSLQTAGVFWRVCHTGFLGAGGVRFCRRSDWCCRQKDVRECQ
jgi:hypothetical protein